MRQELINPTHAWIAITTRALKTIKWPVAATTLSEAQCTRIMAPLLKWVLKGMKLPSSTNRVIVYGPQSIQGIGLPSLYTTMGLRRITHLLNHGDKASITGKLIRTNYQQLLVEVGLPGELHQWNFETFGHLATHCWMKEN